MKEKSVIDDKSLGEKNKIRPQLRNEAFRFCKVAKLNKKPFEDGWGKNGYQWDDPRLQDWLNKGGNYGVLGGFGDLIIFDADELERLRELGIIAALPETFCVRTPGRGGLHFYYICPGIEKKMALYDPEQTAENKRGRAAYKHVADLVALGMQAVGPDSIRSFEGGELRAYEVVKDVPITSIIKEELLEILKPLKTSQKIEKKVEQREQGSPKVIGLQDLQEWGKELRVEEILLPVNPVKDDLDGLGELQGEHPIHGSSKDEGGNNFSINVKKNQWCCYRCGSGGGAWELLAVRECILDCSECLPGWRRSSPEKWIMLLNRARELGFKIPVVPEGESQTEYRRDLIRYGVEIILGSYCIKTLENDEMLIFEDGIYKRGATPDLKRLIQCMGGRDATNHCIDEVIGACKRYTYCNYAETFNKSSDQIPVNNGLLCWKTGELLPFNPEKAFTFKLPVNYDPLATCNKWEEFVKEITESPEDVLILQEFLGYCLLREYPFAKILLLVGNGRNGKSTLLRILTEMLGETNCSNTYLQGLADKFSLAGLVEKMANIAPDIPAKDVLDTSVLKSVSGNDRVPIEQKYLVAYFAILYTKLIFSANKLPRINDDSMGFFDRLKLINFPYTYKANPKPGERQADVHLSDKLRAELPGILNWALAGLQRLMDQEAFTENAADKNPKAFYEVYAAPEETIKSFAARMIVKGPDCRVSTGQVWTAFQSYLQALGMSGKSSIRRIDLAKFLERELCLQKRKLLKIKGEPQQGWHGIKLREDWMDILKLMHEARELGKEEELESLEDESPELENKDDKLFRTCQICGKACKTQRLSMGVCDECRALGLSADELQQQEGC